MPNMIEPNIHPMLVHFTYSLMTLSALSLFIVSLAPAGGWRDTLKHAGDWMLAFGALAIVATVGAGFEAYYSVNHDAPSHAAMTTHRNFAVPTALALLALAGWRRLKRAGRPGVLFAALLLAAAGFLTVTAWWGGRLVFHHGLGVKSMPAMTGEGRDHEHPPGEEHDGGADNGAGDASGHEHPDEEESAAQSPVAAAPDAAPASEYPATPEAVADAFGAALKSGDADGVARLLLADAVIAEGGGAERSLAEYAGHHMPADMAFVKAVETTVIRRDAIEGADMATVITASQMRGTYKGKAIRSRTMETMVLRLVDDQWRIAHIHWSSAEITGEHDD